MRTTSLQPKQIFLVIWIKWSFKTANLIPMSMFTPIKLNRILICVLYKWSWRVDTNRRYLSRQWKNLIWLCCPSHCHHHLWNVCVLKYKTVTASWSWMFPLLTHTLHSPDIRQKRPGGSLSVSVLFGSHTSRRVNVSMRSFPKTILHFMSFSPDPSESFRLFFVQKQ